MSAQTPTGNSGPDNDERRAYVETLLVEHAPLMAAIFRSRMKHHADDALQEFVSSVLMERLHTRLRDLDTPEDRASLLVHAAQDFCVDLHRRERGRRNAERNRIPNDVSSISVSQFSNDWARHVFTEALDRTKAHFLDNTNPHYWHAFAAQVSTPIATGNRPPAPDDLAVDLGFKTKTELHQAVNYVKRRVRNTIHEILLARATASDTDFDDLYTFFMNSI